MSQTIYKSASTDETPVINKTLPTPELSTELDKSTELTREYIAANLWIGNQRADKATVNRMYRSCQRKQRTDHTDYVAPFASRPFSILKPR